MGPTDFDLKWYCIFFLGFRFALLGVLTPLKYSLFFRKYLSKLGLFRTTDVRYLLVITSRRV